MASNYSSVIEHLFIDIKPSRFSSNSCKSIFVIYDNDLDSEAFVNSIKEYTKTLELINDNDELYSADINVKSMSVAEFAAQKSNMKLVDVRTDVGSNLLKTFAVPNAKDGGILIVSDFGDFCNFNDSFEDDQQEKFVESINDFWHIIFLTSDVNMKNIPDSCKRLRENFFIKIDGDTWSTLFDNN